MGSLIFIAIGGALGAMARYGTGLLASSVLPPTFPFATLMVNVSGSFMIGCVYPLIVHASGAKTAYHALLMVGFFSTKSTIEARTASRLDNFMLMTDIT